MKVSIDSFRVPARSRNPFGAHEPNETRPFPSKQRAETYLEQQLQKLL